MSHTRCVALFGAVLCTILSAHPARAGDGSGKSAWGPIPARGDSVVHRFDRRPAPLLRRTIDAPYELIGLPLELVFDGIEQTVVYLDESGVVRTVGSFLKPRRLAYGIVLSVNAGGLTGLGLGATLLHDEPFSPHNRARFGFRVSETGNNRVTFGALTGKGKAVEHEFGAGFRVQPNARFFGIGPRSRAEDESFYKQELFWVGGSGQRRLADGLAGQIRVTYTQVHALGPREEDGPRVVDVFPKAPTGYHDRSDGVAVRFALVSDTVPETGRPLTGGLRRASAAYFAAIEDGDADFLEYRIELQQFVPLWHTHRGLALRGYYSWIDPVAGGGTDDVPFQRLMTNDDPDLMRGYEDFRWRDRGMSVLTAEYRWPIWSGGSATGLGLDAYAFTDVGQVFGDHAELSRRNARTSVGGGIRLVGRDGNFLGRLEFGHSPEEDIIRLRADQVFQFDRGGLFHGRNPVPAR